MTNTEREDLAALVRRIPCETTVLTFDAKGEGSAWLGCNDCARCTLLRYLTASFDEIRSACREDLLGRPENGGYELRKDLRK